MTDPLPDPELDELVAAYLDGEATPAESARVQGDPALLARAEQLRAVSRMVAEPVPPPDAALRNAHIAAALEASSTSPVVTSMPAGRRRPELVRIVSIAAVVLAALVAVPLVLSNGGDDEDVATSDATSADDGLAAMDAVAAEGSDGAAEMAADEEAPLRETDVADDAASGDMAGAESAEMAPNAEVDPGDVATALGDAARIDIATARSPAALRRQVERRLPDESSTGETTDTVPADDLACESAIAAEIASRGPATAVGSTSIAGVSSEYVVFSDPISIIFVYDGATCAVTFAG